MTMPIDPDLMRDPDQNKRRDLTIAAAAIVVCVVLPFVFPNRYLIGQGVTLFLWVAVVSQWNLVFGVGGIFSLAQLAIFAVGGYSAAMLALYLNVSLWFGMFLGGLVATGFSLIVGLACLRLSGAYVALLTLALATALQVLIITDTTCFMRQGVTCMTFTGGSRGLSRFGDFGFTAMLGRANAPLGNYFLAFAVALAAMLFAYLVIYSPIGLAFRAIRDNKLYSIGRGISSVRFQLLIFGASAFFTGMAGAVFAGHYRAIGANILDTSLLLFLLSMMVIGGLGRFWGPLAGTTALLLFDEAMKELGEWRLAGLGAILLLSVIFMPNGIVGLFRSRPAAR
ncbi:MAG: branched-chain amino acid ABC transporter permease [Rhodobacteraceae bacterium]|nr:branched-chain amino acid ABC transporter permease [Paracoccaceae bacterium]